MSERTKININLGLLWTILVTMAMGVYQAGQVRSQLDLVTSEIHRVRPLEDRVTRLESRLGIVSKDSQDNGGQQ